MGAEQFHGNTAEHTPSKEIGIEQAEKQAEKLAESLETSAEKAEKTRVESGEKLEKKARAEALEQAVSVEAGSAEKKTKAPTSAPRTRHGVVSKKARKESYDKHMKQIQAELPANQRVFSKLIHNPVIEKSSEVIGSTIARPNSILAGAIVAFIAVLAVYLIAKHYGYQLSGFETIGAFIVGWVLGSLYDFFKVMITGKKS